MHAELDVQQKEVVRRRMCVMQQEARVARMETELAEHGVRVTYAETQVAAAEGKRVADDRQRDDAETVWKTDTAAVAFVTEDEFEKTLQVTRQMVEEETRRVLAKHKAAAEEKQRRAAESRALTEQAVTEEKHSRRQVRKAAAAVVVAVTVVDAGADDGDVDVAGVAESLVMKLFAADEQCRQEAFCEGYHLYMGRFGLVPTKGACGGEVLVVGDLDSGGALVECGEDARCRVCDERRATHMYVPCGNLCVCGDYTTAWGRSCAGCHAEAELAVYVHGHALTR